MMDTTGMVLEGSVPLLGMRLVTSRGGIHELLNKVIKAHLGTYNCLAGYTVELSTCPDAARVG